ncbi:MAG: cytochrome c-type biogenesis protein CcmH [Solirubrobacterales bacterium]
MKRAGAFVTLVLIAALIAAPGAEAACLKTSLPAVQEEVMCLICGVPLVNAGGPQAEDERNFIRGLIDKCKTKAEIKTALVAEYGEGVLAIPKKSGFDLAAYLVPVVGGLLALGAVVFGAISWRRARDTAPTTEAATTDGAGDAELDKDLQRYDL